MSHTRFVQPNVVISHFHIHEGEVVADYGAGSGYFIPVLASAVGRSGRVYACEIQKSLVETLGALIRTQHLDHVQVLWGDLEEIKGTKIPDHLVDMGIMVNVLFQLQDKVQAVNEIARTLKQGGRLYVVDWSESFGGLGPQPTDVITMQASRALLEEHGFLYEREFPAGEHHYGIMFRKL